MIPVLVKPFSSNAFLIAVEQLIEQNKNEIAAIIIEPVAGNMGCILPQPGFLEGLRTICTRENIVLIFDEVMTGFRLAAGGAQQALNIDASEARKISLATAMFLHFRTSHHLTPAASEPLAKLAGRVMLPRQRTSSLVGTAPDMNLYNDIKPFAMKRRTESKLGELEINYVLGGFPELWRLINWKDALNQFREDLKLFGIDEETLA